MSFYEKIMTQQHCTTEERVRGFVQALEAGDVKALVEYNFDWVAVRCFTTQALRAYWEAVTIPAFLDLAQKESNWK